MLHEHVVFFLGCVHRQTVLRKRKGGGTGWEGFTQGVMNGSRNCNSVREDPQRYRKDFQDPKQKWGDVLPDLLSHSSLMSICVASV